MKKVLITGGAGFIGSHLIDSLASLPRVEIVAFDNLKRGRLANLAAHAERVRFVEGDVRSIARLREALRGVDLVYHLAAQSSVLGAEDDPDYAFSTNVTGTRHVLQAALENGVQRVVFASSREVYGEVEQIPVPEHAPVRPKNIYGRTKAAGEQICQAFARGGPDVRILRLANVYGPRDFGRVIPIFVENALRGKPITLYGGEQVLDFIWVGHVVHAFLQAGTRPDLVGVVNVGSSRGVSIRDLARRITEVVGSGEPILTKPRREKEVGRYVADAMRARRLLNLPETPDPLFRLHDVVEWVRQQILEEGARRDPSEISGADVDPGHGAGASPAPS